MYNVMLPPYIDWRAADEQLRRDPEYPYLKHIQLYTSQNHNPGQKHLHIEELDTLCLQVDLQKWLRAVKIRRIIVASPSQVLSQLGGCCRLAR